MTKQSAYQILEISPPASAREIKKAYLALVEVWHPDRLADRPELRHQATEKLKDLNLAYEKLCPRTSSQNRPQAHAAPAGCKESRGSEAMVRCVECLSLNRVSSFGPGLVCGCCGAGLSLKGKHSGYRPDGRIPCGDDACLGVIGPNGKCTLCGLSLKKSSQLFGQPVKPRPHLVPAKMGAAIVMALLLVLGLVSTTSLMLSADAHGSAASRALGADEAGMSPFAPLARPATALEIDRLLQAVFARADGLSRSRLKPYQVRLRTLGYYKARIDGKFGPKTHNGLRDFMLDFDLPKSKLTPQGLLRSLEVQVLVQDVHHEWTAMRQNGRLDLWLSKLEPRERLRARQIIASDDPQRIVALVKNLKRENRLASVSLQKKMMYN
jgi:hypothetical protein